MEKGKFFLGVLIGIIITAIVGLGYWYFFYDKEVKDDDKTSQTDQSTIITYKDGYNILEDMRARVKGHRNTIAGLQSGLTKDLTDWQKILIAFDTAQYSSDYGDLSCTDGNNYCISENIINNEVMNIFGNSVTVNHDNYQEFKTNKIGVLCDSVISYDKNKEYYTGPLIGVGGIVFTGYELTPYRLELKGSEYILSAYLTYAVPGKDMQEYGEGTYSYSYYTDSDEKLLLYSNDDENITSVAKIDKLLKSPNIGKATKFEFTFKENNYGYLYWYKTKRTN